MIIILLSKKTKRFYKNIMQLKDIYTADALNLLLLLIIAILSPIHSLLKSRKSFESYLGSITSCVGITFQVPLSSQSAPPVKEALHFFLTTFFFFFSSTPPHIPSLSGALGNYPPQSPMCQAHCVTLHFHVKPQHISNRKELLFLICRRGD